ncbi:MAG: lysylphosphatidylglycerol synthase transmembrane domain-containing protein [Candidatus Dormiibacterota bacterium]
MAARAEPRRVESGAAPSWSRSVAVRSVAGLAVGALMVYAFLRVVSFGGVVRRLDHLDILLAGLSGVVFLGAWVVRALRWRRLLRPAQVSAPRAVGIYMVAIFLNWMLPVRGGELAKSLLLRRSNGIPVAQSLPTVTMDKALDLLPAVALLVLLPIVHLPLTRPLLSLLLLILSALVLGALALVLVAWRREPALGWLTSAVERLVPRRARPQVAPFVAGFTDTLLRLAGQPRLLLISCGYTAVAVGLDSLFCFLAFRAVAASVPFAVVLYGYTLYNLAYILPTPPGQIGSNEVVGLLVFSGLFGVSRSAVGAMFLFSHPWTAVLMVASGTLCLRAMGLNLRRVLGMVRPHPAVAEERAA